MDGLDNSLDPLICYTNSFILLFSGYRDFGIIAWTLQDSVPVCESNDKWEIPPALEVAMEMRIFRRRSFQA